MGDPDVIDHYRRSKTAFFMRVVAADGNPRDLTPLTLVGGIESSKGTASNTTCFKRFPVTGHGTHGTISGTLPQTGIAFTGPAVVRVWASGSPREILGGPRPVVVRDLSANWLP
jgi:hypothetical protein